jgi:putative heme iron utilization protein
LDRFSVTELKNLVMALRPDPCFGNHSDRSAGLDRVGFSALKVHPDPLQIASEGARRDRIQAQLLPDTVMVSADADQHDDVCQRALCWGETERLVHKLDAFTDP